MVYKQVKIKQKTDELIDQCVRSFRYHHPELDEIPISRNKIVYEMAIFYLKIKWGKRKNMSFVDDLMKGPIDMADDLFKKGYLPLVIMGLIGLFIWLVFFKL